MLSCVCNGCLFFSRHQLVRMRKAFNDDDNFDFLMTEYPTPEQPNNQDSRRRIPLSRQTIRQLEKQTAQQPIIRKQQPPPPPPQTQQPVQQPAQQPAQFSPDEKTNEVMTVIDSYKTAIDEINRRVNTLTEQNDYQQEVIEKQQAEIEDLKCLVDILFNEEKPITNQHKEEPKKPAKAERKKKPKETSVNTALIIQYIVIVIVLIRSFF